MRLILIFTGTAKFKSKALLWLWSPSDEAEDIVSKSVRWSDLKGNLEHDKNGKKKIRSCSKDCSLVVKLQDKKKEKRR